MKPIVRYEISDSIDAMASALFDLPYNSYDTSVEVLELTKALNRLKERIRIIEDKKTIEVANEVDEKGKPKYSNQSVRDAETRLRLDGNEDYQELKNQVDELSCDLGKMKEQTSAYALMFSTIKNEVFHRRSLALLDSKKELSKEQGNVKVEE
jgi:hypothetical protein